MKPIYKCPYCGKEYDNYDDAEDCADECHEIEDPICLQEGSEGLWGCDICKQQFDSEEDALDCETRHKEANDLYLGQYEFEQTREKLDEAANLYGQRRLEC